MRKRRLSASRGGATASSALPSFLKWQAGEVSIAASLLTRSTPPWPRILCANHACRAPSIAGGSRARHSPQPREGAAGARPQVVRPRQRLPSQDRSRAGCIGRSSRSEVASLTRHSASLAPFPLLLWPHARQVEMGVGLLHAYLDEYMA